MAAATVAAAVVAAMAAATVAAAMAAMAAVPDDTKRHDHENLQDRRLHPGGSLSDDKFKR